MSPVLTRGSATPAPAGQRKHGGLEVPGTADGSALEGAGRAPASVQAGGRLTLGQRLESVWEGLRAGGAPDCPVCRTKLDPLRTGTAGRCGACRSILS